MRRHRCFCSPSGVTLLFLLSSVVVLGVVASLFVWLTSSPRYSYSSSSSRSNSLGCQPDGEGSWSVGVFYGDSPFSLKPIESWNVWRNRSAAWPVANPVFTCASASDAGFPSNFVADPFLYIDGKSVYLFFETKNSITLQGDIGVAKSSDNGSTWRHVGIALNEEWHLSYPFVFDYHGQIYLMPESSKRGELRLYRAVDFPLQWTLEKVILKKPLIDSFIVNYQGLYWLFGSDFRGFGIRKNGELEIWYSSSPLGPWNPHKQNPVHNIDKSLGARNAGRPFMFNGSLYRPGQDCGETYGRRVRLFKVEVLTTDKYKEVEVALGIEESKKGRNAWNGARYHQLDVQQLESGDWIAVMDGDRVPSGDSVHRLIVGYSSIAGAAALVILVGILVGALKCISPLCRCLPYSRNLSDIFGTSQHLSLFSSKLKWLLLRANTLSCFVQSRVGPRACGKRVILGFAFLLVIVLICSGVYYLRSGNGAEEAYPWKGHYSQFTLLTMSYGSRLWNLKTYVKHYSKCSSVGEIVVVWNGGQSPPLSELDSAVPVQIRAENQSSLNNRFKVDPLIRNRAVLELDDDVMMTCDDLERGFKVWREHPDRIVGFYPRLADGSPLKYRDEKYARNQNGYNMILTGAAFIDCQLAFERYWGVEAKGGREIVDKYFDCEDILMNFLYANVSTSRTVEYVRPAWTIDTSKFSAAAISRDTQAHYRVRTDCLVEFSKMYGSVAGRKSEFGSRQDGWDV
uniref:Glucosamine inositolphosphorylceramide transferase 1 n=1 Tax=Anthurium amnicola TaxID=1678845 RepID=A0A1D1Y1X6_9ARAE